MALFRLGVPLLIVLSIGLIAGAHAQDTVEPLFLLQRGTHLRRGSAPSGAFKIDGLSSSSNSAAAVPADVGRQKQMNFGAQLPISSGLPADLKQFQPNFTCPQLYLPQWANWSEYLEAVYHEPGLTPAATGTSINLDILEWFYYKHNPILGSICRNLLPSAAYYAPPLNTAWTTPVSWNTTTFPIQKAASHGFFVRRWPREDFLNLSRVEVMHVAANDSANASWFWAVQGTGVFLNLDKLREHGNIMQPSWDQLHSEPLHNGTLPGGGWAPQWILRDIHIGNYMSRHNVTVLILPRGASFLPEILVRLQHLPISDSACALPTEFLSTGFTVPRPCVCNESSVVLNCDGIG